MPQLKPRPVDDQESLADRHSVEERFHDEKALRVVPPAARMSFYSQGNDEHFEMLLKTASPLMGKRVLDFGCGPGHTSRIYAQQGATRVDGFDISGEYISIAERNAKRDGLDHLLFFRRMAAEDIDYPDESFDVVIGKAILHHTDLEKTARQLARVLTRDGIAVFLEPLAHNPALNLFRWLTPSRRTPTEKPISLEELKIFRRYFPSVAYRGFYLFTLLSHSLLFVTGSQKLFARSRSALIHWEEPWLVHAPGLQKYCWSALLILRKSEAGTHIDWPGQISVDPA